MPYIRQKRHRAPKNYEIGKTTKARFSGTCATTRRQFDEGAALIYTRKGWSINDQETADATTPNPLPQRPQGEPRPAPNTRFHFSNTLEFLEATNNTPTDRRTYSHEEGDADFYGTYRYSDAAAQALTGWNEGTTAIREAREKLPPLQTPDESRAEWFYDVAGGALDIGRAITGEPECFYCHDAAPGEGKILKIAVDICHPAATTAEEVTRRGAQITALIEALELQGFSAEVYTFYANTLGFQIETTIKQAGEPLELDKAAFFLTSAAVQRRLIWAIVEGNGGNINQSSPNRWAKPSDPEAIFISTEHEVFQVFRERGFIA